MATIKKYLSPKVTNGESEIFFRVSVMRGKVWKVKTGIFIDPSRLKADGSIQFPRANQREAARLREREAEITAAEGAVHATIMELGPDRVERENIEEAIARLRHPDGNSVQDGREFFEAFDEYLRTRDLAERRKMCYRSLERCLRRFEMYRRIATRGRYSLSLASLTAGDLEAFEKFYREEWTLCDRYPELCECYPADLRPQHKHRKPKPRGDNAVIDVMRRLRAFFNWAVLQGLAPSSPFGKYGAIKAERYGTPFYLTLEERDAIARFDLSARPHLAVQRDIFVFQCLVGCRVSDLRALTPANIVGDALEYVARKTKKDRQEVVRVPLVAKAKMLAEKYAGQPDGRLFPFVSDQRYNDNIKEICRLCGVDRVVTVINPTTGEDERRPIWEVATSHMARRTFVGNLYKKVKDPSLVSSLSGHKEGSRAFARYREIDDEIKRDILGLIE